MKLRDRLSLTVTGVSALTLLASFTAVYALVTHDELRDLDQALRTQAWAAAHAAVAADPVHPRVEDGIVDVPEAHKGMPEHAAIYGPSGALLSSTRTFGSSVPQLSALGLPSPIPAEGASVGLSLDGVQLRGIVVPAGERGHLLLFAVSRETVDEDMRFLLRVFFGLFSGAMLFTMLGSRWLGERLASDVLSIAAVARSVASGDLAARVGKRSSGARETRELAASLDHMIDQISSLVEAQRTFISHAAHELRSPLATLRGELQLALRRPREPQEYRATLDQVLVDVNQLAQLAEDLLTLARLQAGRVPDAVTACIAEVIGDAVRMAKGGADARHVTLVAPGQGAAASRLFVRGARTELSRAVRNLVDNAVTHGPEGSTVVIAVTVDGPTAFISVQDDGPGVDPVDEALIFSPFYRGAMDRSEDRPGAGLGLAIAREISRAFGGDVLLDTSAGQGARFLIALERAEERPLSSENLEPE